MIKKVKERIESWELNAWLMTILFLSIGAFLFIYFTDIRDKLRQHYQEEFKGQTNAVIISVTPMDRIKQSGLVVQ